MLLVRSCSQVLRSTAQSPATAASLSTKVGDGVKPIEKVSTKLWGGRFSKDVDPEVFNWTDSMDVDNRMINENLWGSMSHVTMLGKQGIIPPAAASGILTHLLHLQNVWARGEWTPEPNQDDIQMTVERKLINAIGMDLGGRMHTCRSRNDQVPLDSKLWTRSAVLKLRGQVIDAVDAFLTKAAPHLDDVMVSYTHVQQAQPVSVAFWLSHYAAHLLRDLDRLKRAYDLTDASPLGAGAIAGTSFPIDRVLSSRLLGFQQVHLHALDATSSRDFMLEVLNSNAVLQQLFSRLAEELILWSSWEFRTVTLDDGFAMGSSMMPQKKNPGPLELMRGRAGRIYGYASAGLTMMKGLPSGYNRDFHEEKELLVASLELMHRAAHVIPPLVRTTTLNLERMREVSVGNFANATELANYLVGTHNLPFRHAHDVVGTLVGKLSRAGHNFATDPNTCLAHLKEHGINAPDDEVLAVLDPAKVAASYNSLGGTGRKSVEETLAILHNSLGKHRRLLEDDSVRISNAYDAVREIAGSADRFKTAADIASISDAVIKKYNLPAPVFN